MKTTLVLDDGLVTRLKKEAARQGRTMSELAEAALRQMLDASPQESDANLPPLPEFKGGTPRVDVANREEL